MNIILPLIIAAASAIGAAAAAWLGYTSSQKQRRQAEKNLEKVFGKDTLIKQFDDANRAVASIKNLIENRTVTDREVGEIREKMQHVKRSYESILAYDISNRTRRSEEELYSG
jgi:mannitol-1-phosphate/altronate dehydrogenase